jgi:hypothetical protein
LRVWPLVDFYIVTVYAQLLTVHDAECVDTEQLIAEDALGEGGGDGETDADREADAAAHLRATRSPLRNLLTLSPSWRVGLRRTWRFAASPLQLCDLLAVGPFYLEHALRISSAGGGFGALRLMRLARVTRIFKLGKQAEAFRLFVRVIQRSLPAMRVLGFFILLLMVLFGALIHAAERGVWTCNEEFPAGAFLRPTYDGFHREQSPFSSVPKVLGARERQTDAY